MTTNYHIFTDGSANPQSKRGVGAFLVSTTLSASIGDLSTLIQTKRFENTSSTQLELETLLWALEELEPALTNNSAQVHLFCYTDCSNIIGLPGRQNKLEQCNYLNTKGKQIKNHTLYKSLFRFIKKYPTTLVKVVGHQPNKQKDFIAKAFTLVDKASRKGLREYTEQ